MKNILLVLFIVFITILSRAQDQPSFPAKLQSVTVYSKGAELDHLVTVDVPSGSSEILLSNLANTLDLNTIQVSVPAGLTVLSTRFIRDFLRNENKSAAYLEIEKNLNSTKKELNLIQNKRMIEE